MRRIVPTLLFPFAILVTYTSTFACVCSYTASACEAFSNAEAVFIGTVNKTVSNVNGWGPNRSHVDVEKVYKGKVPKQVQFAWGSTSCDVGMQAGEQWLLYAHKLDKSGTVWFISSCGRSRLLSESRADLKYLDSIHKGTGVTRLSGHISYKSGLGISNARVEISGSETAWQLSTDTFGFYEIYGLPPGTYSVRPQFPPDTAPWSTYFSGQANRTKQQASPRDGGFTVIIGEEKCVEANVNATTDTYIRGSTVTNSGEIVTDVCVTALKVEGDRLIENGMRDCVNDEGTFLIHNIPPGRYLLRVDNRSLNRPWAPDRFPSVFYPDSLSQLGAETVVVNSEEELVDLRIVFPKSHPVRVVKGLVSYADGSPAPYGNVLFSFRDGPEERYLSDRTDSRGRFSLTLHDGIRGRLMGYVRIFEFEAEQCPKLKKLFPKDSSEADVDTKPITFNAGAIRDSFLLKLPFTACPSTDSN